MTGSLPEILFGEEQIAARVEKQNVNPQPRSGQQEYLENLINRFV